MPIGRYDNLKNNSKRFISAGLYQLDPKKTENGLYSSFVNCSEKGWQNEIKLNVSESEVYSGRRFKNVYKTNIISFKTLNPKNEEDLAKAHAYSEEVGRRYLGPNAMYIVSTHNDAKHINSHILSSNIPLDPEHKLKNFDTSKRHMNHDWQKVLIEVAQEMNLDITFDKTVLEQFEEDNKEKYSKVFGTYFENATEKAQYNVKFAINEAIETSLDGGINTYKDFIKNMEKQGWEFENIEPKTVVRNGKSKTTGQYLKVKIPGRNQFTSLKKMVGFTREDIKNRLAENNVNKPDLNVFQYRYFDLDSNHFANHPEEIDFAKAQNDICIQEMLSDAGDHGFKSPLEWYLSDFGTLPAKKYADNLKALKKMKIPQFEETINGKINIELKFLNKILNDISSDTNLLNSFIGRKKATSTGGGITTTTTGKETVEIKNEEVINTNKISTINQAILEAEDYEKKKKESTDLFESLLAEYRKKSENLQIQPAEISQPVPNLTNLASKQGSETHLETQFKTITLPDLTESVGEGHGLSPEPIDTDEESTATGFVAVGNDAETTGLVVSEESDYYEDVLKYYQLDDSDEDIVVDQLDFENAEDISKLKNKLSYYGNELLDSQNKIFDANAIKNYNDAEKMIKTDLDIDSIEPIDKDIYSLDNVKKSIKKLIIDDFNTIKNKYVVLKIEVFDGFITKIAEIQKQKQSVKNSNRDRSKLKPFNKRLNKIKEWLKSFFVSFEGYIKGLFDGTGEFKAKNIVECSAKYKKSESFNSELNWAELPIDLERLNKNAIEKESFKLKNEKNVEHTEIKPKEKES